MQRNDKVLLFDLGNILVSLNAVDAIWSGKTHDGTSAASNQYWAESQAVRDYESGRIPSLKAFYEAICKEVPVGVSEQEFYDIFHNAIGDVFPGTYQMLNDLRRRFPLYLLSNTSEAHWSICREKQKLDGYFIKTFLSYEMGVMKPDPLAFKMAIEAIQTDPQNIWYYDDREENVREAINKGLNAFLSHGGHTLFNDLRRSGFMP